MADIQVTATLVNQIDGLGNNPTYYGYQFLLKTAGETIAAATYDLQLMFVDNSVTKYIYRNEEVVTAFDNTTMFTLPGVYYSLNGTLGTGFTGTASIFNFDLN